MTSFTVNSLAECSNQLSMYKPIGAGVLLLKIPYRKPKPQIYLNIFSNLNVQQCVYVVMAEHIYA